MEKSLQYAYRDRRQRKRQFRALWILRINAACRRSGIKYGEFINRLNRAEIAIDRKQLADLAVREPAFFQRLLDRVGGEQKK